MEKHYKQVHVTGKTIWEVRKQVSELELYGWHRYKNIHILYEEPQRIYGQYMLRVLKPSEIGIPFNAVNERDIRWYHGDIIE